ncbi:MAG: phosphoenolpyruvate--protein phosphotransferase [Chloroflexi bacterium RBG_16_72_14]|nr:MAG: phosphoenolpyruvate--protein phosphotransferase [Chloroflexi bacterium RBG_16_72_14]
MAAGPWVRISPRAGPKGRRIDATEAEAEILRLEVAAAAAAEELDALAASVSADGHPDEGAIFGAQAAMARDPALTAMAADRVHDGHDAIGAIGAAGTDLADQLRALGDELLSARAADVEDVAGRIAGRLAGRTAAAPTLLEPAIVVATDLSPSVTAMLPRDRLLGLALEAGSPTAHAAILARAYSIPAVVGVAGLLAGLEDHLATPPEEGSGTAPGSGTLWIDGGAGEVVLDPDRPTAERLAALRREADQASRRALAEADLPVATRDGTTVSLLANIGTPAEADRAVALGAHGVGLFRTEFLFIERPQPPTEEEQLAAYRAVVDAFRPHPVTIRLLDVGGDKPIPYLAIPDEANPFLGVRALRLAPERPDLFVAQLRAAMRAAAPGRDGVAPTVKVMAPMVADAGDAELLLQLAARAQAELAAEGLPHGPVVLGVMLEIPGAVLVGDTYLGRLGFASLGTNDLLQYTLAVDRGNPALARYQDPMHPALLRLVHEAVQRSARAGAELSVCGEMAGDPVAALALVGLGIRHLSMASGSLAVVRRSIRSVDLATLEREATAALDEPSAAVIRRRFAGLAITA